MGTLPSPSGDVTPWKLINALADHYNKITDENLRGVQSYGEDQRIADRNNAIINSRMPPPTGADVSSAPTPITPSGDTSTAESPTVYDSVTGSPINGMIGWKSDITKAPTAYQPIIEKAAAETGIPTFVLASMFSQESGFNPKAVSPAGAQGVAQFMPATARSEGVNPWDVNSAIPGAARYLAKAVNRYNGNIGLGLASYNAGSGRIDKFIKSGYNLNNLPPETRNYIKAITGKSVEDWIRQGGTEQAPTAKPDKSASNDQGLQQFASDANNRYSWLDV